MKRLAATLWLSLIIITVALNPAHTNAPQAPPGEGDNFTFALTADMRYYSGPGEYHTPRYFKGACEALAAQGSGTFMLSPGDIDPPANVNWTITQTLGAAYIWYPVVGNHEAETPQDMNWLQSYDCGSVAPGPSGCPTTTYSFDYRNAHFVVLNEYCDITGNVATEGDISDHLYQWLTADLSAATQDHIFVFGHEPAYPQPDADVGRTRHLSDSLNQYASHRDRFWDLLGAERVAAYICGHTHNYSVVKIDGVWQMDVGHARGMGDTGAPSTFVLIHVDGDIVTFETYRDDAQGGLYTLAHQGFLVGTCIYLPVMMKGG